MVTPENLYSVLAALKDAGVTWAKLGDCEFRFAPEVEPPPLEHRDVVVLQPSAPLPKTEMKATTQSPLYESAFRGRMPAFKPVTE